ncbi:MAG: MerR family transcriptional regulator [Calditrichaeota bacterium]|nr:MerR family transcriptional regulator [Calditrichota bacterium]MCB9366518.1 MerR family transcriptional regulator [Calditrichota bacterium]MCB9391224.1 MerR family transcriptional regulator [Calditrichota bacterium]
MEAKDSRVPQLKKLYYSIGEVADQIGVQQHVLRYWESEFPKLHPKKGRGGNRLYTENDVALITKIHDLLHNKRFTIAGAKQQLELGLDVEESTQPSSPPSRMLLREVQEELKSILELLGSSGRGAAR